MPLPVTQPTASKHWTKLNAPTTTWQSHPMSSSFREPTPNSRRKRLCSLLSSANVHTQQAYKVIWQKAASLSCHHSRRPLPVGDSPLAVAPPRRRSGLPSNTWLLWRAESADSCGFNCLTIGSAVFAQLTRITQTMLRACDICSNRPHRPSRRPLPVCDLDRQRIHGSLDPNKSNGISIGSAVFAQLTRVVVVGVVVVERTD